MTMEAKADLKKLKSMYSENNGVDLLKFDFHDKEAVERLGIDDIEPLKACQRLERISRDMESTGILYQQGFDSAHKITNMTKGHFIKEMEPYLGKEKASRIYQNAYKRKLQILHLWANIKGIADAPYFRAMRANPVDEGVVEAYKSLPSYEEMFGGLDYLECGHDASIFGPAAYFTDLMRIIDKYITRPNCGTISKEMIFEARRPDLFEILLTEDETNTLVPYSQIVNQVLERRIKEEFKTEDLYFYFAGASYPFDLPFNLYLYQIRSYLEYCHISLGAIYKSFDDGMHPDENNIFREALGLSIEEQTFLTHPITDAVELKKAFGLGEAKALSDLKHLDTFLFQTGLGREAFQALVYQGLSQDELFEDEKQKIISMASKLYINKGLNGKWIKEENGEISQIDSIPALDGLDRFIRLSGKTGWPYAALDWALTSIQAKEIKDDGVITAIGKIKVLEQKLQLSPDILCSFWYDIKTIGKGDGADSQALFDRIFNNGNILKAGVTAYHPRTTGNALFDNPRYTDEPQKWQIDDIQALQSSFMLRIASSLEITTEDLLLLGKSLFMEKGVLPLTVSNLSCLYRHVRLAKLLSMKITDYFLFLNLIKKDVLGIEDIKASLKIIEMDQLFKILEVLALLKDSSLNLYEIDYIINENESVYVDPMYSKDRIKQFLTSLWARAKNVKQESRKEELTDQLATFYGTASRNVSTLMEVVAAKKQIADYIDLFFKEFPLDNMGQQGAEKESYAQICEFIKGLSAYLVLVDKIGLSSEELDSVVKNGGYYNIPDIKHIGIHGLCSLIQFKKLTGDFGDKQNLLISYFEEKESSEKLKDLSSLTGFEASTLQEMLNWFSKASVDFNTIQGISKLKACFDISTAAGIDIHTLQKAFGIKNMTANTGGNWKVYGETAAAILDAIKAKYPGDAWNQIYSFLSGAVEDKKEEVLDKDILWRLNLKHPEIKNLRNVYEYLLIDVEMKGDTLISHIKEGLNACQLYLNRCRMNLEAGIYENEIPEVWWEWIMNYRVWEANRKVFLYPENYLDPGIRKSRTALFKELENELLQSDITDEFVEAAYKKYLDNFIRIASLRYVDAYFSKVDDPARGSIDTLFLFARTDTEPYSYYYCTQENKNTWTEWKKIEVTINSKFITPVYAFGKIFIFWVELKKVAGSELETLAQGIKSKEFLQYKAAIKYSFCNFNEKWVQPQSLGEDRTVNVTPDGYMDAFKQGAENPFTGLFDMEDIYWNKVYVVHFSPKNYVSSPNHTTKDEKIAILYGPSIDRQGTTAEIAFPQQRPGSSEGSAQKTDFEENLYLKAMELNHLRDGNIEGYILLNEAQVINKDLQKDTLLDNKEYLLLVQDTLNNGVPAFRPVVDNERDTLSIIGSSYILQDNYFGDFTPDVSNELLPTEVDEKSFITGAIDENTSKQIFEDLKKESFLVPPQTGGTGSYWTAPNISTLVKNKGLSFVCQGKLKEPQLKEIQGILYVHAGDPVLLSDLGKAGRRILMVKNQPDWFIFDAGSESFLFKPEKEFFLPISEAIGIDVPTPVLSESSFIVTDKNLIDAATSKKIYDRLKTSMGIIDKQGRVISHVEATFDAMEYVLMDLQLDSNKLLIIKDVLLNQPKVNDGFFATGDIPKDKATDVFNTLKSFSVIDYGSRLNMNFNIILRQTELSFLSDKLNKKQRNEVMEILKSFPSPVSLSYRAQDGGVKDYPYLNDYRFQLTRLTTGSVDKLNRKLFAGGINGLLSLQNQQIPVEPVLPFDRYRSGEQVISPAVWDGAQVAFDGPYGLYYWELFFHTPYLVASRLNGNKQFKYALRWFQYIFNPTQMEAFIQPDSFITREISRDISGNIFDALAAKGILVKAEDKKARLAASFDEKTDLSFLMKDLELSALAVTEVRSILLNFRVIKPAARYWQFQPFRNHDLEKLKAMLVKDDEIETYNDEPFDPHAIARLRMGAYEKSVVMKYIDNLLDWGDYLFAQDDWESIASATMLYTYAYDLLGERPAKLGACEKQKPASFENIRKAYDEIPQFLIDLENHLHYSDQKTSLSMESMPFNDIPAYFCIPENDLFIAYWDRVEDRLYKIRHSMNIEGVKRQLALFQRPLNPMDLIKAAGTGGGSLDILAQQQVDIPHYRFSFILERAKSMVGSLMQLGASLLSAMEKRDAENLSLIRNTQEQNILDMTVAIKEKHIKELEKNQKALEANQAGIQSRYSFYDDLIKKGLTSYENSNLDAMATALEFNILSSALKTAASIGYGMPQVGSPFAMTYGGIQIGAAITAASGVAEIGGNIHSYTAQRSLTMAGYERRKQEWEQQRQLAGHDLEQIQNQIDANGLQLEIAKQELEIHKKTIAQNKEIDTFLKSKFTNAELYQWMISRISSVYFGTYKIALEYCFMAQKCYQYELDSDETLINFGTWDSLKKGLLAGEALMLSLSQLEKAYIEGDKRRYEIEKTISLLQLDAKAWMDLRTSGKCTFTLEEALFDKDFPGHYGRKIKAVDISIPAVIGPYQNIHAMLTQTKNSIRLKPKENPRTDWNVNQRIALSKGVNDSGCFELSLRDERYLPFEGKGAVSTWELSLPKETNRINFDSISDVIIHLRYTALQGDTAFTEDTVKKLAAQPYTRTLFYSLNQAYPDAWQRFVNRPEGKDIQQLTFKPDERIPLPRTGGVTLEAAYLRLNVSPDIALPDNARLVSLRIADNVLADMPIKEGCMGKSGLAYGREAFLESWSILFDLEEIRKTAGSLLADGKYLDPDKLQNIELMVVYR